MAQSKPSVSISTEFNINMHKSFNYTNKIKSDLTSLFSQKLSLFKESTLIAATGSLGKGHLTPGSDIDLLVIVNDNNSNLARELARKIKNIHFTHQFELYPIVTLKQWKMIARESALLCSDLFFAKPIWGKTDLFYRLKGYIKKNNLELQNRFSYFVYNLLYRDDQLKKYVHSDSLKYQPGGLRDLQFFLWVGKRLGTDPLSHPPDFVKNLSSLGFVNSSQEKLLKRYTHALLNYKWELESASTKHILAMAKINFEKLKLPIILLADKIKNRVLSKFGELKGQAWMEYVIAARRQILDLKTRWKLVKTRDETLIFCGLWNTEDTELIEYCLRSYSYWTVRSAIALNSHTTKTQLKKLFKQNFPDMEDIQKFIRTNMNYRP